MNVPQLIAKWRTIAKTKASIAIGSACLLKLAELVETLYQENEFLKKQSKDQTLTKTKE